MKYTFVSSSLFIVFKESIWLAGSQRAISQKTEIHFYNSTLNSMCGAITVQGNLILLAVVQTL